MKHEVLPREAATERPISVAIVAMGGQGGGVLTNWIAALAEDAGWAAQATSVAGVAQRTGATLYYVEMMRLGADGRRPILAQMPTAGDVDVVLAAEYMEAGRSILRGLATPDRTVLIASDHRALATSEKITPGSGLADSGAVTEAIGVAARKEIRFDMQSLAAREGTVISAALFGALAGSGALPFPRDAFEAVIRAGDKGVEASLRAFDAAFVHAESPPAPPTPVAPAAWRLPERLQDAAADALLQRIRKDIPAPAQELAYRGLQKVAAFQGASYGAEYLDQLVEIARDDSADSDWAFTAAAAKHLANAMTYDDIIRVAGLKTRAARRARVEAEIGVKEGQLLATTEYFHPRMAEIVSLLPARWARGLMARKGLYGWLDRRFAKGRRVRTYAPLWFCVLYIIGGLARTRKGSLRDEAERAHRAAWLKAADRARGLNYDLGVEILNHRRLIKGYSDTHARGLSKFDKVMAATRLVEARPDAADWARRLREAALKDAEGAALDGAIKTIESFA